MSSRSVKIVSLAAAAVAVAVGAFVFGRISADAGTAHKHGYDRGRQDGYLTGLADGTAQGREEGRATQVAVGPAREAFNAGYDAGADDVFAGYDGGWGIDTPYVITLERANGHITYRIASRDPLLPAVLYYLCPDGHSLCQQRR